ncbi:MAG: insulinase family protein [Verrucomicrobiae bacterium]|nr:insulinase family protein [Verrucomicrobiae bacterium]
MPQSSTRRSDWPRAPGCGIFRALGAIFAPMTSQPQPQLALLSNGVRVATIEMPHMQSVSIGFWTGTGSRHESAAQSGIAHFIEHLLFKGTPTRSSEEISRQIERLGGSIDAFTTEDHTAYQVKGPAEQMEPLIDVLADLYQHPRFDPDDLENERNVIREEIAMVRDQPSQWLEDLTSAAAWPGHPLGRAITGTEETLGDIDRSAVIAFHRAAYTAPQTVVTVAGRVTHDEVMALLAPRLANLPTGTPMEADVAPPKSAGFAFARRDDLEQAHLAVGFHACGRHEEGRFAQKLLNVLLGENMSSRLFQELREREGLCYEVQSDIMAFEDTGLLHVYVALDPSQVGRALTTLRRVLAEFAESPPGIQELEEAKSYLIGQSRIALENTASQMMWAGECLLSFGKVIDPEQVHQRLTAVTPAEIQEIAGRLFRADRLVTAAVGPKGMEKTLRAWHEAFEPGAVGNR